MANPMWVAGSTSANPSGRPKRSIRTVRGMVENFIRRNITPNKLQKMFGTLTEKDKLDMLLQLLPYAIAKQSSEGLSKEEAQAILDKVEQKIKQQEHGKAV